MPKTLDLIIGRSLLTGEAIAAELRSRLIDQLGSRWESLPPVFLLTEARRILATFEPLMAEAISRTDLASWIAGFRDVAKKLPPPTVDQFSRFVGGFGGQQPPGSLFATLFPGDDEPIIRFPMLERAAESLMERRIMTRAEFDAAGVAARANAFTVTGDISADTIETIRDVLAKGIDEGASLARFREEIAPALEGSGIGPARLETIFRTNVMTAFHDGQDTLASNQIVAAVVPYKTWDATHDARVRPTHLALETLGLSGTNVFRASDPFWRVWKQPAGYNCRCSSTYITIDAAARMGVAEAKEWLRTSQRPPLESRLPFIPFAPDPGFGLRAA